jgi:hypothetical protein
MRRIIIIAASAHHANVKNFRLIAFVSLDIEVVRYLYNYGIYVSLPWIDCSLLTVNFQNGRLRLNIIHF